MSATADTATNPIRLHPTTSRASRHDRQPAQPPQPDDELYPRHHTRRPRLASEKEALELVDVATLARMLGVSRRFIYEHQAEMGVIKLEGLRAPLRFDSRRPDCDVLLVGQGVAGRNPQC